ncbi:DUF349 domain-containing protein [Microbacterium sp. LRZ72]|uniref:DUF349 domain-containing protein n=1 Tax=Microbacterium sp. LRZ72 TaxID=2942481 RepID=UPI0029AE698F|nr:DUF349 domain-containing protein [Microbacterium sp. LRZ72]MDX2375371.1 DUF349 domain-containing protein [Microbacterium sp. LRZ72]
MSSETASTPENAWGRVDDDGTVHVREGDGWRVVGQFPDGSPDEALAYFERKYTDLADRVALLEQRQRRGGASASDLTAAARHLRDDVTGASAVGDLAALTTRIDAIDAQLVQATAEQTAAAKEAVAAAAAEREALVEKAEALAARDPRTVQWKQASQEMTDLFAAWQAHQQDAPRLPKSQAQALWKRFRDARTKVDKNRREFFAELDEVHKAAREQKTRLAERAEALVPQGEDGIPAYRGLLDQWKAAGRAGKKADDALWARFKAAGDALYGARAERDAAEIAESEPKIAAKQALLDEARAVEDERDLAAARATLTGVQRRWDEIGRVAPREKDRALDDALRKIEQGLRSREDVDWKRNNPETKARAGDMARQLTDAIAKLEDEVDRAESSGDSRKAARLKDELATRRSWLSVVDS